MGRERRQEANGDPAWEERNQGLGADKSWMSLTDFRTSSSKNQGNNEKAAVPK